MQTSYLDRRTERTEGIGLRGVRIFFCLESFVQYNCMHIALCAYTNIQIGVPLHNMTLNPNKSYTR